MCMVAGVLVLPRVVRGVGINMPRVLLLVQVLLVLVHKAGVVGIQVVAVPAVVIVSVLPRVRVVVLVVVVVVYMGRLCRVRRCVGVGSRSRHMHLLVLLLHRRRGVRMHRCSMLRGGWNWCWNSRWCRHSSMYGAARMLLGWRVGWRQGIKQRIMLLNFWLDVLWVLVRGVICNLHVGPLQLRTQAASRHREQRASTMHKVRHMVCMGRCEDGARVLDVEHRHTLTHTAGIAWCQS